MVPSVDASVPTMYQHQIKKMYRDFQSQARDLEREMKEGKRLRQELEERDAAVQDARSVARTAKQQLVRTDILCLPVSYLNRSC